MILLDKTKISVGGVDVYPDHADENQFWMVPDAVHLSEREKKKVLSYIWYIDSSSDSKQHAVAFIITSPIFVLAIVTFRDSITPTRSFQEPQPDPGADPQTCTHPVAGPVSTPSSPNPISGPDRYRRSCAR